MASNSATMLTQALDLLGQRGITLETLAAEARLPLDVVAEIVGDKRRPRLELAPDNAAPSAAEEKPSYRGERPHTILPMAMTSAPLTLRRLEDHIWQAADLFRNKVSNQKDYILALLFFKRACDLYDEELAAAHAV